MLEGANLRRILRGASWFVYMVKGRTGSLYTGVSSDVERRVFEHNNDKARASKWCWSNRPVQLVWMSGPMTKSEALTLEAGIKSKTRAEKLVIVGGENATLQQGSRVQRDKGAG